MAFIWVFSAKIQHTFHTFLILAIGPTHSRQLDSFCLYKTHTSLLCASLNWDLTLSILVPVLHSNCMRLYWKSHLDLIIITYPFYAKLFILFSLTKDIFDIFPKKTSCLNNKHAPTLIYINYLCHVHKQNISFKYLHKKGRLL